MSTPPPTDADGATADAAVSADGSAASALDHGVVLAALRDAFADWLDADEDDVDLLPDQGPDGTDIVLAAEAWTLDLSGWPGPGLAIVAIEDEPDEGADAAEVEAAWRAAVPAHAVAALRAADDALGGALTAALTASGDALSAAVATAARTSS